MRALRLCAALVTCAAADPLVPAPQTDRCHLLRITKARRACLEGRLNASDSLKVFPGRQRHDIASRHIARLALLRSAVEPRTNRPVRPARLEASRSSEPSLPQLPLPLAGAPAERRWFLPNETNRRPTLPPSSRDECDPRQLERWARDWAAEWAAPASERWGVVGKMVTAAGMEWKGFASNTDRARASHGTWSKPPCPPAPGAPPPAPAWARVEPRLLDEEHRRMVKHSWRMGLDDAHWLGRMLGLQPSHSVLEIGCGAGRVSVHLIRFLRPGHYACIEADGWSLYAQMTYELPLAGLLHRRPRFLLDPNLRLERALPEVGAVDAVVAFASVKHSIPHEVIQHGFCAAHDVLRPGGVFVQLQNLIDTREPRGTAVRRLHAAARACGFELAHLDASPTSLLSATARGGAPTYEHSRPSLRQPGMGGGWGVWRRLIDRPTGGSDNTAAEWSEERVLAPSKPGGRGASCGPRAAAPAAAPVGGLYDRLHSALRRGAAAPKRPAVRTPPLGANVRASERSLVESASAFEAQAVAALSAAGLGSTYAAELRHLDFGAHGGVGVGRPASCTPAAVSSKSSRWRTLAHVDDPCTRCMESAHHRAAGPPGAWLLGLDDASFALAALRRASGGHSDAPHSVLEIGCGAGRVSVHLIRFLRPGHYACIEADGWSLYAQMTYELPLAGLLHRRPRFWHDATNAVGRGDLGAAAQVLRPRGRGDAAWSVLFVDATNAVGRGERSIGSVVCVGRGFARAAVLLLLRPLPSARGEHARLLDARAAAEGCGLELACATATTPGAEANVTAWCTYPLLPHAPRYRWQVLALVPSRGPPLKR